MIRELGLKYPKMFLSTCNWFQALPKKDYFEHGGDHADELETSLMLHLAPHLVLPLEEAGDGREKKHKINEFSEGWAWSERKWSQISVDTGTGNPKASTPEKGAAYFTAVTTKISEFLVKLTQADVRNLYE
jgi:creatinine amidohydrolase